MKKETPKNNYSIQYIKKLKFKQLFYIFKETELYF